MKLRAFTLRCILNQSAERFGDLPALGFLGGRKYSYAEVEEGALKLALRLAELGLRRGDKVAILSENRPEWGIAYLGIVGSGLVAVPILTDFAPAQIEGILRHAECSAAIVSAKLSHKLPDESALPLRAIEIAEAVSGPEKDPIGDDLEADPVPVAWDAVREPEEADLASIVYTSGTTGRPKGVMLSHRALAYDAWTASRTIRLKPRERILSILPLAHSYECTVGFLVPLLFGGDISYLERPPSASVLLPALAKLRPTMMISVPLVIEKVVRGSVLPALASARIPARGPLRPLFRALALKAAGIRLKKAFGGKLWFFGIGGAALAPDVEDFLLSARFPFTVGYGLTEAAPLVSGSPPGAQVPRSAGLPLRGVEVRIDSPDPEGGVGEILVRGLTVMDGYFKEPGLSREAFTQEGWLKTGDLGRIDRRGRLYIRGRSKTAIIGPSGENVYPEEIEALLDSFDPVRESLVYGDARNGLTALVRLKSGAESSGDDRTALLESLRKAANARLAAFSRIDRVHPWAEPFARTPSEKLKREERAEASRDGGPKGGES